MMPPERDQADIGTINVTLDASDKAIIERLDGTDYDNKDMARQEFAKEADINYMLSRFNITPPRGAPTYGEWDDTIDLQQALTSVAEARSAYKELPEELKNKFKNMEELITAYTNGSLIIKDGDVPVEPKTETELLQERILELENRLTTPATPA